MIALIALAALAAWIYLLCGRGWFWRCPVRDSAEIPPAPAAWPPVTAVIPARNEAEVIAASVGSLLRQTYQGPLSIVVVDDDSSDDTAALAAGAGDGRRDVTVLRSHGPPAGWTGKLWALKQGIAAAEAASPKFLLLTDADIVHAPDTVAWLAARASSGGYVLTSLMAKLRCESLAERTLVPAFIYFFQLIFPFAWVGGRNPDVAAAAGGCMLVRADALRRAGGVAAVRDSLIDDCALAAALKNIGPMWLGLTERVRSIRPYPTFADVERMIARSAYAQLRYSPLLLVAALAGMTLTFLAPPLLTFFASGSARYLGAAGWLAMALSMQPTLRLYRLSPLWGLALPGIALLYALFTIESAYQHLRRRGGQWKGRVHVNASGLP
jgi:hopene-associated glycosyltransferase HpnB